MKIFINALIVVLIFVSSLIIVVLASYPYDIAGFPHGVRLIVLFIFVYLLTVGYSNAFAERLTLRTVLIAILIPILLFILMNLFIRSMSYSVKIIPLYLTWFLGFFAGIAHHKNGFQPKKAALLALFPIIMAFNVYELWMHRMEFGNFTGKVSEPARIPFGFSNKNNQTISNKDLQGKVVWLDFWFIGCPPCWKLFPEVQQIYDEHKSNPSFELFAVNRYDDPDKLFSRIEEKGYTFPVLRATKEDLDALGVYFFPTVILLNKKGEIVFTGELEGAKSMLVDLLEE